MTHFLPPRPDRGPRPLSIDALVATAAEALARFGNRSTAINEILRILGPFPPEWRPDPAYEMPDEYGARIGLSLVNEALEDLDEIESALLGTPRRLERDDADEEGAEREASDEHFYRHAVRRPDEVRSIFDFRSEDTGTVQYWIPRRFDVRRYVRAAAIAHARTGRPGRIRIVDVGGGPGFLGKLMVDEGAAQGLDLEVVVLDPDTATVERARAAYADTPKLRFVVGTAEDGLFLYGPARSREARQRFDELACERRTVIADGRKELRRLRAAARLFAAARLAPGDDRTDPLSGRFRAALEPILARIRLDPRREWRSGEPAEAVARLAEKRNNALEDRLKLLRALQASTLDERPDEPPRLDLAINAWMPMGLDFTPEIRWMQAPAIIYVRNGSATGVAPDGIDEEALGADRSYERAGTYESTDYSWSGWGTLETIALAKNRDLHPEAIDPGSESFVQTRANFRFPPDAFVLPAVAETEKYPWERSLEQAVGRETVRAAEQGLVRGRSYVLPNQAIASA